MKNKGLFLVLFIWVFVKFPLTFGYYPESGSPFSMLMASDPQLWWVETSVVGDISDIEKKNRSEKYNRELITVYNQLFDDPSENIKGLIINGDLTAFGHADQFAAFKKLYVPSPGTKQGLVLKVPSYFGLGNHDYQNNVDDCFLNNCAFRMINFIRDDFRKSNKNIADFHQESMAYSFEIGDYHFVQLHNYPTYQTSFTYNGFFTINIKSSLDWLNEDLKKASLKNKIIVLNFHDLGDHFSGNDPFFEEILRNYNVQGIFVGHIHSSVGLVRNIYLGNKTIPVFRSGSASYQTFLKVNFFHNRYEVFSYRAKDGILETVKINTHFFKI